MLGMKTSLNRLQGIIKEWKIMFFDCSAIKLETSWKFPDIWKVNNIFISNPWIKEEISRKIRKYLNWLIKIQYIKIHEIQLTQSPGKILVLHFIHLIFKGFIIFSNGLSFFNDILKNRDYTSYFELAFKIFLMIDFQKIVVDIAEKNWSATVE